jgi:hypothetical protein
MKNTKIDFNINSDDNGWQRAGAKKNIKKRTNKIGRSTIKAQLREAVRSYSSR